jgi:ABC-type Zn uptake system ZnuABC Zn-binding protein ZnuA
MKKLITIAAILTAASISITSHAAISVITTDTTLADIAKRVGGNRVTVESLARPTDDPHAVEPRPSMVVKLSKAQVFARIGMDLDMWADSLIERAGNSQVAKGGKGYADCSVNLKVQEIPPAKLDPSMGDVHVYGNPHYLMDPANGILAAGNIAAALIRVDPSGYETYHNNFIAFGEEVKKRLAGWSAQLAPFRGNLITTYHRSWVYFMTRFGLKEFGTIEPKPGIQPSAGHVNDLVREMKSDKVKLMLIESFRSHRYPDLIAQQTGAKAVYVPLAVGADPEATDYFKLFDVIVGRVAAGLK